MGMQVVYVVAAFFLGLLVGWFIWGKLKQQVESVTADYSSIKADNARLMADLESSSRTRAGLEGRLRDLEAELTELRSRSTRSATVTVAPTQLISMPPRKTAPSRAGEKALSNVKASAVASPTKAKASKTKQPGAKLPPKNT